MAGLVSCGARSEGRSFCAFCGKIWFISHLRAGLRRDRLAGGTALACRAALTRRLTGFLGAGGLTGCRRCIRPWQSRTRRLPLPPLAFPATGLRLLPSHLSVGPPIRCNRSVDLKVVVGRGGGPCRRHHQLPRRRRRRRRRRLLSCGFQAISGTAISADRQADLACQWLYADQAADVGSLGDRRWTGRWRAQIEGS